MTKNVSQVLIKSLKMESILHNKNQELTVHTFSPGKGEVGRNGTCTQLEYANIY